MSTFELKSRDGKILKIEREWTRLGRAEDNDLIVKDPSISRYHVNFYIKEDQLIVEDAGSQNGFLVNGKQLGAAVQVKPGDRILVGATEYYVRLPGVSVEPAPSVGEPQAKIYDNAAHAMPVDNSTQKRIRLYAIVVIALFAVVFFSKKEEKTAAVAEDAASISDRPSPPSKPNHRTKSPSEIRSESLFREAMRDYEDANYSRAMIGFQDARTLNPENEEALNYIEFSETRLTNQLNELLKDGNRSMKYLQYRRGKSQAARILAILSEQIPGFGRKIAQESNTAADQRRTPGQEETLLQIPCDKTRNPDLCNKALEIIRESRRLLGEEETWQ